MPTSPLPILNSKETFIYFESISTPNERILSYLSPEEKLRAERYKTKILTDRFVVARARLRELLGECLGISPNLVEFTYNAFGKPALHPKHVSNIQFNLSHSHDRLAIALAENAHLGIDIEKHSPGKDFSKMIFSEQELKAFDQSTEQLFQAWTMKEAYLKAIGCGLVIDMRTIDIDRISPPWVLYSIPIGPGWSSALAINQEMPYNISHAFSDCMQ